MKNHCQNLNLLLCTLLTVFAISACTRPPAEEAIRIVIAEIESAVEEKNSRAITRHLSQDFIANDSMDKHQLRQYLAMHFLGQNNISVVITRLDIEHSESNPYYATMNAVAAVTGAERFIPDDGRLVSITADWQYQDKNWVITRVNWE